MGDFLVRRRWCCSRSSALQDHPSFVCLPSFKPCANLPQPVGALVSISCTITSRLGQEKQSWLQRLIFKPNSKEEDGTLKDGVFRCANKEANGRERTDCRSMQESVALLPQTDNKPQICYMFTNHICTVCVSAALFSR